MKSSVLKYRETGIAWQDKQHKELFDRLSALSSVIEGRRAEDGEWLEEFLKTIDFLDEYVAVHFYEEERAMVGSGYPDSDLHMERHHLFIEEMAHLRRDIEASEATTDIAVSTSRRMVEWLVDHICVMDKDLAAYIK
ncbi:MAG: hemerythrin family protein [Deltaproteobacteria bacterium]|nr:hemerythrin family protein [Deltaproteobacteria bacterium]